MNTHDLITIINDVFKRENLDISLTADEFEGAVIKKLPKADICRWKSTDISLLSDEAQQGFLNIHLVDREDETLRNPNGQTHLTYNKGIEKLFSAIPFSDVFSQFSVTYPCTMVEENLHLLLKYSPANYYSEERKNYLLKTYNEPNNLYNFELALKIEEQNRVMVANKTSILDSDLPINEKVFLLENRFLLFRNDYIIILKLKKQMKYTMFFIPTSSLEQNEINLIGSEKISITTNQQTYSTKDLKINNGLNTLVFGAPGTGKSHFIKEEYEQKSQFIRVVFHEEYSYQDFVGSIKPVVTDGLPTYEFVPGPFTQILKLALENKMSPYTLIIEELNRANAASVFGDVFQLLDRDDNAISEYSIENKDILNYLNKDSLNHYSEIKIPGNLSIVATMNSADQGVFPIDTAFKRRWNYEYMPIQFDQWHTETYISYLNETVNDEKVTYNISVKDYIEIINAYLSQHDSLEINEDRLIGPYYLRQSEWVSWESKKSYKKLLAYLWDDIARLDRAAVFKNDLTQFLHVCNYTEQHRQIFTDSLHTLLLEKAIPTATSNGDDL